MTLLHDDSLGFLLADVSRLLRRTFEQSLEGSTLTLAQARALVYVALNDGAAPLETGDLVAAAGMHESVNEYGVVED